MPVQPRTPPGVLELLPAQQLAFQTMLDTIRRGFERFGYMPIETPVFEQSEVLLTKSGGETVKQMYFVQSTGTLDQERMLLEEYKARPEEWPARGIGVGRPELALRFDLTVPLARYVAQHEHELNFPFRRYQIQRVYRGERAQKGRYREFYQCDIDVIGKDSLPLAYDAELPAVIHGIFRELGFGAYTIYLNNRKLLRGLLASLGIAVERQAAVLHEVDRLGKQDRAQIEARLANPEVGLAPALASRLLDLLTATTGDSRATLEALRRIESPTPELTEGLAELTRVYEGTLALGVPDRVLVINLAIVRGLDYYTGTVYETFLNDHPRLGSICSGGRYENLAGEYTKSRLPGVGISIGATRLFSQLLEMNLIQTRAAVAQVLVLAVEPALALECAGMAAELRDAGFNVEVYGGDDKLGKQFKYADRARVPFTLLYGTQEKAKGVVKVKDLRDPDVRTEHDVPRAELVARVKQLVVG